MARGRRLGDNAGMARDDGKDLTWRQLAATPLPDGARPSTALGWVSPVAPVVTQVAAGAGHWAAGRRRRALAEWVSAAGFGLVAWGLATEAPTRAEAEENLERLKRDLWRARGTEPPATAKTTPGGERMLRYFETFRLDVVGAVVGMVVDVPWRLRHPRRLTVFAIAAQAPSVAFNGLRAAGGARRRRPRMAVGSALIVAGSVARLRAASAEPLQ